MLSLLLIPFACSTESTVQTADASLTTPIVHTASTTDKNPTPLTTATPDTVVSIEDWQGTIATQAQLNMAIVEADGKYHTWMEGRSGTLRTEPKNSFWLEQGGISTNTGKGQLHMEIDGHSYYTAATLSKVTIATKLENSPKNTSGLTISLEMTSKGKYITSLTKKDARNIRLASSVQKPSRSAILQIQNPQKSLGEPTPILSKTALGLIKNTSKVPETAKTLPVVAPKAEQINKWNIELKGIFGNIANVGWSTMVNLDADEFVETLLCTPTPKGETCFVYDEVNAVGRYYDSGFKWDGKVAPVLFGIEKKIYIYHSSPLKKGAVHKILQFDGSGYKSTQL